MMRIVLLGAAGIALVVLIITLSTRTFTKEDQDAASEGQSSQQEFLSNQATCSTTDPDVARVLPEPFRVMSGYRAAGVATAEGRVVSRPVTVWGESITAVYLAVGSSSPRIFEEFNKQRIERGNSVNRTENNQLLYKLGILSAGKLESSATISERANTAIRNALDSNEPVTLTLQIPVYEGSGAPADFTFACAVALEDLNAHKR